MKVKKFQEILLNACVITAAADGRVDETELAVVRDAMTRSLVGEDEIHKRIEKLSEITKKDEKSPLQRREECLEQLSNDKLTNGQYRRLIDLCCRIARADRMFEHDEAKWLQQMIGACGLVVGDAISLCPKHAAMLRLLEGNMEQQFARSSIEISPDTEVLKRSSHKDTSRWDDDYS